MRSENRSISHRHFHVRRCRFLDWPERSHRLIIMPLLANRVCVCECVWQTRVRRAQITYTHTPTHLPQRNTHTRTHNRSIHAQTPIHHIPYLSAPFADVCSRETHTVSEQHIFQRVYNQLTGVSVTAARLRCKA